MMVFRPVGDYRDGRINNQRISGNEPDKASSNSTRPSEKQTSTK